MSRVYTIKGNTSSASGVMANGGAVAMKSYPLNYAKIVGYGRPKYDAVAATEPVQTSAPKTTTGGYDMKDFKNASGKKLTVYADKLMELRSRITALEQQWLTEQGEIEQALDQLTETEANVFRAYYCTRQSWARVGEILDYSERQLYRIRKSGLKKLAEMK